MRVRDQLPHFRLGVHGCIWLCGGAAGDEPAQPTLEREKVSGWPRRCGLAHAFLWEHSNKGLELGQLLGQLGVSLTLLLSCGNSRLSMGKDDTSVKCTWSTCSKSAPISQNQVESSTILRRRSAR
jgi:hypothetical protein